MGDDEMTPNAPTAPHLKSKEAIIEGIERGLADIKASRTVSHDAAMTSLRKIINAAAGEII
jgi:predicted transcriptional regulator